MNVVTSAIEAIESTAKAEGLPSFAKRAGVPYTTLLDWQRVGWRPKAVATLEKLALAAEPASANDDSTPSQEAA